MKNYWRMSDFSLFSVHYAYVDHSAYLADQLFVKNKVAMKFMEEMAKDGTPFRLVFCKVRKRDVAKFEESLGELNDKMRLLGYADYSVVCDEIAQLLDEGTKSEKRENGNTSLS